MTTAHPHYERGTLEAFRRTVERYCTSVNAGSLDPDSLRISVSVLTRAPTSRDFGAKVHRIVHRYVDAHLPHARVVSVGFAVDPVLPEPGHRFLIQPPALPAPKQTLLFAPPPVPSATAHLTLRYGADFRWACHLASAPGWVPLGRWTGGAIRDASVRLPEYATFLPRGELLYLRHDGHRLEFARSRIRPDYLVTIDGTPLRPDGRLIQAGAAGAIGYTDGTTASTLLEYHLAWEGGHG
jgi:hypothetical protein